MSGTARWGRRTGGEVPLVIAHRGASADRPENTLAAFLEAEAQGADGVELDVVQCQSGEVVVFHDDTLARLAGRPGAIRSLPWSELRSVRVAGEPMARLDEVLRAIGPDLLVNIELKAPEKNGFARTGDLRDDGLPAAVARILDDQRDGRRVLVSAFFPLMLARLRRLAPWIPTGLLFHGKLARPLREAWAARPVGASAVHPEAGLASRRAVEDWHSRGFAVNAWTVDDPAVIRALFAAGVDGLITNRPAATRAVVEALPRGGLLR